jgi:hypothetical protein
MSRAPTIGKYLYSEEEELFRAIESDNYKFGKSALTPERKAELQQAARRTLNVSKSRFGTFFDRPSHA